jgi:hypothetical protein
VVTRRHFSSTLTTCLAVALAPCAPAQVLAQGCSMCQTALDGPSDPLAQAFNVSSLFLMALPYTLVGGFAAWITLAARRRARETSPPDAVQQLE